MAPRSNLSVTTALIVASPKDQAAIQDGLPPEYSVAAIHSLSYEAIFNEVILLVPDLVVIASKQARSQDITVFDKLMKEHPLPIIWFVENDAQALASDAIRVGVTSFVVDGLKQSRITSLLVVALERYRRISELEGELQKSKDSLAARKVVERAKGLLMAKRGLSEHDAYEALRNMAMRQGKSLKSVCDMIIEMSDLLP